MINIEGAYMFCRDDISLIENYYEAKYDQTELWICHHKDELRVLPSGIEVRRTVEDLKNNGRYYNCPANELIFLRRSEHAKLHATGRVYSEETKTKLSKSAYKQWNNQRNTEIGEKVINNLKCTHKGQHWKLVDGRRVYYEDV